MDEFPKLSLTGDLGSGKSAVSRILEQELGFRIVSTGSIQREIARNHGMTTLELNEYTKTHPEIDDEIDGRIAELQHARESLIFDSRLAWHFAPGSFKGYLLVDSMVAANRIFNDKRTSEGYGSLEETYEKLQARRKSETERFKAYYGIDYADLKNYDLVVESTDAAPEEVAECIMHAFRIRAGGAANTGCFLSPYSLYPTKSFHYLAEGDKGPVEVCRAGEFFFILAGHNEVCHAITASQRLLQVHLKSGDVLPAKADRNMEFLKEWEQGNGFKFRQIPEFYG